MWQGASAQLGSISWSPLTPNRSHEARWDWHCREQYLFRCKGLQRRRMGNKDSDPSASVLDLGEDDLPGFSTAFDTVASGASEGDSDSGWEAGHAEQLLYWEVCVCAHRHIDAMHNISLVFVQLCAMTVPYGILGSKVSCAAASPYRAISTWGFTARLRMGW